MGKWPSVGGHSVVKHAPFWTSPSLRAVLFFQASTNWPPRASFTDVDVCASAVLQLLGAFLGRHTTRRTTRRFIPLRNDPKMTVPGSLLYLQMGCTARSPPAAWIAEMSLWTGVDSPRGTVPAGPRGATEGAFAGFGTCGWRGRMDWCQQGSALSERIQFSMHLE